MGSFRGHVLSRTLFLLVGVWHMWSSIARYVSYLKSFRVRVWNPVPGFDGRLKYLELYFIIVGGFIDLCTEFLYSTHLHISVHGILNPSHMNNFKHSGMLLMKEIKISPLFSMFEIWWIGNVNRVYMILILEHVISYIIATSSYRTSFGLSHDIL
ncbi:uncharacterized protein LOC111400556 [Olea europaea var. sylvestris]|uniref:uncharacterized protein LOC111400556 n=1 Tax=Olea europaea var. sylvestris TaxID=158386 RepID=UPI000C1D7205|nr:uncharacterized protein LOC111400556 [Olea europaea var. sylvestris]